MATGHPDGWRHGAALAGVRADLVPPAVAEMAVKRDGRDPDPVPGLDQPAGQ